MAQIRMPQLQQEQDPTGKLMQLAGAGIGAGVGGFPGAMAGAQAGGMLSGFMPQQEQAAMPEPVGGAMTRRQATLDQSPLRQIRQSIDSLKYVQDDQQRMELAKPLLMAQFQAKKGMA